MKRVVTASKPVDIVDDGVDLMNSLSECIKLCRYLMVEWDDTPPGIDYEDCYTALATAHQSAKTALVKITTYEEL